MKVTWLHNPKSKWKVVLVETKEILARFRNKASADEEMRRLEKENIYFGKKLEVLPL